MAGDQDHSPGYSAAVDLSVPIGGRHRDVVRNFRRTANVGCAEARRCPGRPQRCPSAHGRFRWAGERGPTIRPGGSLDCARLYHPALGEHRGPVIPRRSAHAGADRRHRDRAVWSTAAVQPFKLCLARWCGPHRKCAGLGRRIVLGRKHPARACPSLAVIAIRACPLAGAACNLHVDADSAAVRGLSAN